MKMPSNTFIECYHVINPDLFQWNIRLDENDSKYYIIEAYARSNKAKVVANNPFFVIIGSREDFPNIMDSFVSVIEILSADPNNRPKSDFYGMELPYEEAKKYNTNVAYMELPVSPEGKERISSLKGIARKNYIYARETIGYVQPIQKSWMYEIQKGSMVILDEEEQKDEFPRAIVFMIVKSFISPPDIRTIRIDYDVEHSLNDEPMVSQFCYYHPVQFKPYDMIACEFPICTVEEFRENYALHHEIIKRKSIFPYTAKVMTDETMNKK